LDVCHLDEAGLALTLPSTTSWGPAGERLRVPYFAPQGRRLNLIGGYFTHGPQAGDFQFALFASLPIPRSPKGKDPAENLAHRALKEGLAPEDVGKIDSEVFLAFVWQLGGRPTDVPPDWKRERPLVVVIDNYSVHKGARVQAELPALQAADIYLLYLPAYSPELSRIEPLWKNLKYHQLTCRSCERLGELKTEAERALTRMALELRATHAKTPA
jgi:transposase